ncbi:MAG: hypothetical protein QW534_11525, partial [Candidatus Methanomethylicia archaeon]
LSEHRLLPYSLGQPYSRTALTLERKPINPNKPLFSRALRSHLMDITSKSGFSKLPKNNLTVSILT